MAGGDAASSNGGRHDRHLLRVPADKESDDERRLDRIHKEVEGAFHALREIDEGVSVFGSARIEEGHRWYELARETAACLARHGYTVITGGGPGLMEAANRGAAEEAGSRSVSTSSSRTSSTSIPTSTGSSSSTTSSPAS